MPFGLRRHARAELAPTGVDALTRVDVAPRRRPIPSIENSARLLSIGRLAVGAAFAGAPVPVVRALGVDTATARRTSFLARMFGVRDGVLGAGTLATLGTGRTGVSWLLAGAVSDVVDASALLAATRAGRIDKVRGGLAVAVAAGATVIGLTGTARALRAGAR